MKSQPKFKYQPWQPIATAPKDGTSILAFGMGKERCCRSGGEQDDPMMCVINWGYINQDYYDELRPGVYKKVQRRVLEFWRPIHHHFFKPSHWMPLPEAPKPNSKTWKPMPAPLDWSRILTFGKGVQGALFLGGEEQEMIAVAYLYRSSSDTFVDRGDGTFSKTRSEWHLWKIVGDHILQLSHWMPLPKPPTT